MKTNEEIIRELPFKVRLKRIHTGMLIDKHNARPPKYVESCRQCGEKFKLEMISGEKPTKKNHDFGFDIYNECSCDTCNEIVCSDCVTIKEDNSFSCSGCETELERKKDV